MVFYVYMLKCISDNINKSYVGYTNNLKLRLNKHNKSKGAKSTRGYKWKIIYKKRFNSKNLAMSYEYHLKKDKNKRKLLLNK
jgi:putative endonuclease